MTDPAPPARTPLTPEERAEWVLWSVRNDPDIDGPSGQEVIAGSYICKAIHEAETAARAEGRLAGLREATSEVEAEMSDPPDDTQETTWGFLDACQRIDKRIRGLAEDVPKAPKNQADQADPDLL